MNLQGNISSPPFTNPSKSSGAKERVQNFCPQIQVKLEPSPNQSIPLLQNNAQKQGAIKSLREPGKSNENNPMPNEVKVTDIDFDPSRVKPQVEIQRKTPRPEKEKPIEELVHHKQTTKEFSGSRGQNSALKRVPIETLPENLKSEDFLMKRGVMKTQDLFSSACQNLDRAHDKKDQFLERAKLPEHWTFQSDDTQAFFRNLPNSTMSLDEFMNEDLTFEPQNIDTPDEVIANFQMKVGNGVQRLRQNLLELNMLFDFSQRLQRLFSNKTKETIGQNKSLSEGFRQLSNNVWNYIENKFPFMDSEASQEVQDVAEKITSQAFFSEVNSSPDLRNLVLYFQNIFIESRDRDIEKFKRYLPDLLSSEVLDEQMAKDIFGEDIECMDSFKKDKEKATTEKQKDEGKMQDSSPLMVQDLFMIDEECENRVIQLSEEMNESQVEEAPLNYEEGFGSFGDAQEGVWNLNNHQKVKGQSTPMNVSAITDPNEFNIFQQTSLEFADVFGSAEFNSENNFSDCFLLGTSETPHDDEEFMNFGDNE